MSSRDTGRPATQEPTPNPYGGPPQDDRSVLETDQRSGPVVIARGFTPIGLDRNEKNEPPPPKLTVEHQDRQRVPRFLTLFD